MSVSRTVAHWLMKVAARLAPSDRAEWTLAMRREFDTMESGGLGWALGCLAAATGWMLRAEWLYLLLLALPPFYIYAVNDLQFKLLMNGFVTAETFREFMRSYGTLWGLLQVLPLAILLGFYRPDRKAVTIMFGCLLAQHVGSTLLAMYLLGGTFLSWWDGDATLYMAPPLIGLCASLWVWYAGASAGAWLRARRVAAAA